MFVDEIDLTAKAGDGGDGVVRWLHFKFQPKAGPGGGNGGKGGDVYFRAVHDLNKLSQYTGAKAFKAENGQSGRKDNEHGKGSDDVYIDVPVGSTVIDRTHDRQYDLLTVGETVRVLRGGRGGLGNTEFKSSTNTSPEESTKGKPGEEALFTVSLSLIAEVGLIGLPNSGKSTLLNTLTRARSAIGAYPFTTLEPHLGNFFGHIIADIPGLIEGAAAGKGLGYKFLKHAKRTKMLLHLVALDVENVEQAYITVKNELSKFDKTLLDKEEWIILTKKDLVNKDYIEKVLNIIDKYKKRVFVISESDVISQKKLADSLAAHLERG